MGDAPPRSLSRHSSQSLTKKNDLSRSYSASHISSKANDRPARLSRHSSNSSGIGEQSRSQARTTDIKVQEFRAAIECPVVRMKRLRSLCFDGIPEEPGLRATCWRLLLGYIPPERASWATQLQEQRTLYQQLLTAAIAIPDGTPPLPDDEDMEPAWKRFYDDNELIQTIDKDVRRTCPDFAFFQHWSTVPRPLINGKCVGPLYGRINTVGNDRVVHTLDDNLIPVPENVAREQAEQHWEVVERILFTFAKLNRGIGYVQGMNEILVPIYHVMVFDKRRSNIENAEADAFFCFSALMSEVRNNFIEMLDQSDFGIRAQIRQFERLLAAKDPDLSAVLNKNGCVAEFYAFRWISLLLSREFPLPDVIAVWDSLLSDPHRFNFLIYLCVAMTINLRERLIRGDFAKNMDLLQHYPSVDVMILIRSAHQMWENDILEDLRANEKKEAAGNSRRTSIAAGAAQNAVSSFRWLSGGIANLAASASHRIQKPNPSSLL